MAWAACAVGRSPGFISCFLNFDFRIIYCTAFQVLLIRPGTLWKWHVCVPVKGLRMYSWSIVLHGRLLRLNHRTCGKTRDRVDLRCHSADRSHNQNESENSYQNAMCGVNSQIKVSPCTVSSPGRLHVILLIFKAIPKFSKALHSPDTCSSCWGRISRQSCCCNPQSDKVLGCFRVQPVNGNGTSEEVHELLQPPFFT